MARLRGPLVWFYNVFLPDTASKVTGKFGEPPRIRRQGPAEGCFARETSFS
jgi:hypothetical protein